MESGRKSLGRGHGMCGFSGWGRLAGVWFKGERGVYAPLDTVARYE